MYSEIAANKRKTWIIMFLFVVLVGAVSWAISSFWFGEPSITIFVLLFAAVYALFSYFSASKVALSLNGAKEVDAKQEQRLYSTVENLAITNGMPMPKVYVMEDPALNAFATGRDPDHAAVAATRGLLNALTDAELEGVMAHELGHVKNYDIRVSMIAFALVTVIALISDIMLRSLIFGRDSDRQGGGAGIIVGLIAIVLAPIAANLLKLAVSRKREYLADATGALTTRYPEGLATALEKISKQGSATRTPNTATAHLFFANPLKGNQFSKLFSTHPPIEDRIAKLRDMEDGVMGNGK